MAKRTLALVLALVMCLGILAGCQQDPVETTKPTETTAPTETTVPTDPEPTEYTFPAGAKLDIYPYRPTPDVLTSNPLDGFIEDATGLDIEWLSKPTDGGIIAMLSDDVTPSLYHTSHLSVVNEYGRYGAFINLWDYQDIMPNFFAEFLSEERTAYREAFMLSEDELYGAPVFQNIVTSNTGFIVRKDIMEELKLETPTDWDSFYTVLKAMKAAYPNSYPIVIPDINFTLGGLQYIGPMFDVNFHVAGNSNSQMRLDRETGKYYESLETDEARELLRKLRLLVEEELMDIACLAYDTAGWIEAMASGHSFIVTATPSNFDTIQAAGQSANPDFALTWWTSFPMVETDLNPYYATAASMRNWSITTRCADVELACRFLDWMYTEEAQNILSWGVEGVSYVEDTDGNKTYIEGFDTTCLGNSYLAVCDPLAVLSSYSDEAQKFCLATYDAAQNSDLKMDPLLTYDSAGQMAWDTYAVGYRDVRAAYIQKFILGQYDINSDADWQAYKDALDGQGQAEQIAAAEAAYAAMQG